MSTTAGTMTQIMDDTAALESLLTELGGDVTAEQGEIVDQWFAELDERRADKVDGYAWQIKALREQAEAAKRLADELLSKSRSAMSRADWLTQRMASYMELAAVPEMKGHIFAFKFQAHGGKAPLVLQSDNPEDFPEDGRVTVVTLDKNRIRERVEAGETAFEVYSSTLPVGEKETRTLPAVIGERGRSLRIR